MYRRQISRTLEARLAEPRKFMQIVIGPRQTGKTTAVKQALDASGLPYHYVDADRFTGLPATQIAIEWDQARILAKREGKAILFIDEVSDKLWKRTDYTWPCTWFAPRTTGEGAFKTAYDVMNNWGANHGAISYGHIGADLITMCSMLRIPVCMHNVPEDKIFRPAAWNAFGMDKEGQDYRACAAYGPMYK